MTRSQEHLISDIAHAVSGGDRRAAREEWHKLIQDLSRSTRRMRESDVNVLVWRAISPTLAVVRDELAELEAKLEAVGDDAQLADVDLQNVFKRQQQTLRMLEAISKMLYSTAVAVIRKIEG